ncbi:MAG: 3,4-dihydroxy 2-butanone 4-phosphate synthase/GTP cyclohydrolase II, partial [Myxococcota bacterium]
AFRSQRCDCGRQLEYALSSVRDAGCGAVLYMRQEGRGIGLVAKLQAYELQDRGRDTVEANVELGFKPDMRDYAVAAQILHAAGYRKLRLMTNNPHKISGLTALGLTVTERVSAEVDAAGPSQRYLRAKREKMGHLLEGV